MILLNPVHHVFSQKSQHFQLKGSPVDILSHTDRADLDSLRIFGHLADLHQIFKIFKNDHMYLG